MTRANDRFRRLSLRLAGAGLLALSLAAWAHGDARAQGAGGTAAPAKAGDKVEAKAPAKTADQPSVKQNVHELGREVSDPGTLQRIKAHEQDLEKRIQSKREKQRKDHGAARPGDAVDLAKGLDKPDSADAPAKTEAKPVPKAKARAATPAATPTPTPAQK